ncbi:MAG: competence/damage-inducible protein A [Myxococcaceae bacterium]
MTAAAVIIGNEVLSAKVREENGAYLIKRLRDRGIPLRWVGIVPDEIDAIVEALGTARRLGRYVFTSGGIGPTHDDVTVRAVALALGRKLIKLPEMVDLVEQHYGPNANREAMRMAEAPEGAVLHRHEGLWFPVVGCDDVYMLPGVPKLFRLQLEVVLAKLPGKPFALTSIFLREGEAAIASLLDGVALSMPDVGIGSYPVFDSALDYSVKLTVENEDPERVNAAVERLLAVLPPGAIVRVE